MSRSRSMAIPVVIALAAGLGGCRNTHSYSRAARTGARLGFASYGGFEIREHESRPAVGLYLRPSVSFPSVLEVGVDLAADPEEPGDRYMLMARGALCYFPTRTRSVYLVVGGGGAWETYASVENSGGFAEGGIGHRRKMMGSELDLRLVGQALFNSDNAGHAVMATVGISF
ncbi:MAG: hypothetical protein ACYSU0_10100 [Planctomycetota bacterium]